jgi:hypothetical protein
MDMIQEAIFVEEVRQVLLLAQISLIVGILEVKFQIHTSFINFGSSGRQSQPCNFSNSCPMDMNQQARFVEEIWQAFLSTQISLISHF